MDRRNYLKKMGLGAGLVTLPWAQAQAIMHTPSDTPAAGEAYPLSALKTGMVFNESVVFQDELTLRPTRRLTVGRPYNQMPTYHIHTGFSANSQHLVMCTYDMLQGGSALLLANAANGDLRVLDTSDACDGFHYNNGNHLSLVAKSNTVIAMQQGRRVIVFDAATGRKRTLIDDFGSDIQLGAPIGSIDGSKIYVAKNPKRAEGKLSDDEHKRIARNQLIAIDMETGKEQVIFDDTECRNNHLIANPLNPDLLLIDRDRAPSYQGWGTQYEQYTRGHIINVKTGKLTPLKTRNPDMFQIHCNWNFEGTHVYYHGLKRRARADNYTQLRGWGINSPWDWYNTYQGYPHYIGVCDLDGNVVWEGEYPYFYYGHVCSHTQKNAIIIDGLISSDTIHALHWQDMDKNGNPRVEVLGRHGSDWSTGQQSHPHCLMSPDGQWLGYNRGHNNRSDVYVLQV